MISQSEELEGDSSTETQYAYYPTSIADATAGTMVTTVQASDTLLGQTTPAGKYCSLKLASWLCRPLMSCIIIVLELLNILSHYNLKLLSIFQEFNGIITSFLK